ncbi:uncharacterized protein [Eurosta solidaginis]|uniref:uncharacterized protein n=1 Tax=Eurosta solidaginis TaxID=178769 RepID=UPI0035317DB9
MNKRTLSALMSIEEKKYRQNVKKFRKSEAARKLAAAKREATNYREDPLSFKKAIEAEFSIKKLDSTSEGSMDSGEFMNVANEKGTNSLLKAILDLQNQTFSRIANIEARLCTLESTVENFYTWSKENTLSIPEEMARDKMIRESKVLVQKLQKSVCQLTGEETEEPEIDITASLPISSYEAAVEFEDKMSDPDYKAAVKLLLFRLKKAGTEFEKIFRELYSDDFIKDYNWEGKQGKNALMQFTLATDLLYEASNFRDRPYFNGEIRKCIVKSHHRVQQRNFHHRRQTNEKKHETKHSSTDF